MGFSSLDDFITSTTTDGKFLRTDWNKNALPTTAQTAGLWYDLACGAGNPGSDTAYGTGTNLAFQALSDTSTTSPGLSSRPTLCRAASASASAFWPTTW